jgi:hypothetical protein
MLEIDRFMEKVSPEPMSGCWLWTGAVTSGGYGTFTVRDKTVRAHRYSFEHFRQSIPAGLDALHKCDVRMCVNPDHIFIGSHADNMADKVAKRRQPMGDKHGRAKLTEEMVLDIRTSVASGVTQRQMGDKYNVSNQTVSEIVNRKKWRHVI